MLHELFNPVAIFTFWRTPPLFRVDTLQFLFPLLTITGAVKPFIERQHLGKRSQVIFEPSINEPPHPPQLGRNDGTPPDGGLFPLDGAPVDALIHPFPLTDRVPTVGGQGGIAGDVAPGEGGVIAGAIGEGDGLAAQYNAFW
jgi:hypothetical protein